MKWYYYVLIAYFVVSNVYAIGLTAYDKKMAGRRKHRRVPEKTLLLTAALSGCVGMYITMHLIHHKTKHKKFMIGIPVIFLLEAAAAVGILFLCGAFPFV